jgi:signal transduction histidine kinase
MKCAPFIVLMVILSWPGRALGDSVAKSIEIFADGILQSPHDSNITVPHNTSNLRFLVEHEAPRVRYRLSSLESKWKEKSAEMCFIVRFLRTDSDQVHQQSFPAVGTSLGWKGSLEKSLFTPRRETITVPQDAKSFYVVISSAGPPTLVGVFAASGINIQSKGREDVPSFTYLRDGRIPDSDAKVWRKSGTHGSMASAIHLGDDTTGSPVLIINDDDIKAHADWNSITFALREVVPGGQLEVEWNEAYSAGDGGPLNVEYERLPAGVHSFEVEELSITGTPLGAVTKVLVNVLPPIWQRIWFWIAIVGFTAVLSTLGGRYLIRKRITQHLEKAQLISDERLRIARDLHDDLGTRLSHISLLSSFAQSSSPSPEVSSNFGQISAMSRELIGALSETVWMLNPKNNQLEALVDFLCRMVSELCRLANIRCRIDAMSVTENVTINHEFRHNMSLAVKEVVNNALKHSSAEEITMTIRVEGKLLLVTLTDNGIGMTQHPGKPGIGLASIQQRMTNVRGSCTIEPLESNGLKVSLAAPIN